jgi:hypothetical protein
VTGSGFGADRFGWPDDALAEVHTRRGWTEAAIERLELTFDASTGVIGFPLVDATGDTLGVLRYLPYPEQRNGKRKTEQPAGVPRQLFPPPETIGQDAVELVLTEGEPDQVAAASAGYTAVAVPGVEGWKAEYAGRFAGRRWTVFVVFDADAGGRRAAHRVAGDLAAAGVDARVVDLAPERDDGYDVTDYLLEYGGPAFGTLLDEAEPYAPELEPDADAGYRLTVRTAAQILAIPEPVRDPLLGPLLDRGYRTVVVGDTGHGKTSFALQMLGAVVKGETMLGYDGAGAGPALVVDLEQGLRSIKRGLREAGLDGRDDVLYVTVPDGLALDRDPEHLRALDAVLAEYRPALLLLDPYYKAHRADDPNAERPIIDLMRALDGLRAVYDFALILPAHPRKDVAGREGARKLTVHDVAGSGAATRGAEIVLGLERLGHGYARLRYLKDRDGDLPVGDHVSMLYSKDTGFRLDPKDSTSDESLEAKVLEAGLPWSTVKEWRVELGVREAQARRVLDALVERGELAFAVGPPGRNANAKCYSGAPEAWEHTGAQEQFPLETECAPGAPGSLKREPEAGAPDEADVIREHNLEAEADSWT